MKYNRKFKVKKTKKRSEKYEQKIVSYQQILRNKINKMNLNISDEPQQGEIEMMFLVLMNGLTGSFLRDKKDKFILPTYEFLADVLNCTVDWVGQLIKKHQKRLGLKKLDKKYVLSKENSWMGKFKSFVWVIYTGIKLVFKDMDIYFFRTKKWKNNLKNSEVLSEIEIENKKEKEEKIDYSSLSYEEKWEILFGKDED